MARALLLSGDLLFGSRVQGALQAAGHSVEMVGGEPALRAALAERPAEALVIDLTDGNLDGATIVAALATELVGVRTLGFYSHVEPAVRERGEAAGIELVVPRSRMAREGAQLLDGLLSGV